MNELIIATVEHLRGIAGLSLDAKTCDEQPDGQPPPNAGQIYVSVHEGSWTNTQDECLDEYCGVNVTVTLRAGFTPQDRKALTLNRRLRVIRAQIRAAVHNNYTLMNLANTKLVSDFGHADNGFIEPLRFRNAGKIDVKGPDWFWADADTKGTPASGVACTLVFERARRVQTNESME